MKLTPSLLIPAFALCVFLAAPSIAHAQVGVGEKVKVRDKKKEKDDSKDKKSANAGPSVGDNAPEFTLKDDKGKQFRLRDQRGKVVVIDFWATWCGPCVAAMPKVEAIHNDYKAKDVLVYGINTEDSKSSAVRKFMSNKKTTYGSLMDGDDVSNQYKVSAIPAFFVIDAEGKIAYSGTGFREKEIRTAIDKALAAKDASNKKPEEKKPEEKKPEAKKPAPANPATPATPATPAGTTPPAQPAKTPGKN